MTMRMKWAAGGLALAGMCLLAWAAYVEPSSLTVARYRVRVPEWGAVNRPLRMAVLGDLHVGSPYCGVGKLREIVQVTNRQHPDLILLAGDYVIQGVLGGHPVDPLEIGSVLAGLQAPLGVYAVLGNHDYWWGAAAVVEGLGRGGVRVLENESIHLEQEGTDFWLVGIGDVWLKRHDVRRALTSLPPGEVALAFTHNPDVFPQIPESVALTAAAHTHGGQVSFPFFGSPIVPSRYGQRYVAGVIEERGRHLFVTPGLGTSILPLRFGVPPEISIVELE